MSLTVVRYRESPVFPSAEVEVSSPQDAVTLLRAWQQAFPSETNVLLDEDRQPIALTQPVAQRRR